MVGCSSPIGDPSNRRGWKGLVIRIVGVGREGVVAAEELSVGVGLSGSSSRLRGRMERKIFFKPARVRRLVGDLGGMVLEIVGMKASEMGDMGGKLGDRGVGGAGKISAGNL